MVTGRDGFIRIKFFFSEGTFQVKGGYHHVRNGDLVADVGGAIWVFFWEPPFSPFTKNREILFSQILNEADVRLGRELENVTMTDNTILFRWSKYYSIWRQ